MTIIIGRVEGGVSNARFAAFVRDRGGPIYRHLEVRAVRVQARMTRDCPRHTARLASTIRKNDGVIGLNPHIDVVCGREGLTDYLGHVLNGTPPHIITPRGGRPNGSLRFMAGGVVVYTRLVRHPGTRPNNFMTRSLEAAAG